MLYVVSGSSCSAMENFFFFTGAIIGSLKKEMEVNLNHAILIIMFIQYIIINSNITRLFFTS